MTDLIKRDDALKAIIASSDLHRSSVTTQRMIRALPAIDPAAIREAAMLDAGYDTTLTDRIEELVKELADQVSLRNDQCRRKLEALSRAEAAEAKLNKAVETLREIQADGPSHGAIKYTLRAVLVELEKS